MGMSPMSSPPQPPLSNSPGGCSSLMWAVPTSMWLRSGCWRHMYSPVSQQKAHSCRGRNHFTGGSEQAKSGKGPQEIFHIYPSFSSKICTSLHQVVKGFLSFYFLLFLVPGVEARAWCIEQPQPSLSFQIWDANVTQPSWFPFWSNACECHKAIPVAKTVAPPPPSQWK